MLPSLAQHPFCALSSQPAGAPRPPAPPPRPSPPRLPPPSTASCRRDLSPGLWALGRRRLPGALRQVTTFACAGGMGTGLSLAQAGKERAGGQMRAGSSAPGCRGLSTPSFGHPAGCLDNGPGMGRSGLEVGRGRGVEHVPHPPTPNRGMRPCCWLGVPCCSSPEARSQAPAQRRGSLGWGSRGTELRGPGNLPDPTPDTKAQGHRAVPAVYKCLPFYWSVCKWATVFSLGPGN